MTTVDLEDVDVHGPAIDESVKLDGSPGTGKTTSCAARVARLVEDEGVDLGNVVWVTYRKSLARDTLERLADWGVIDEDELDEPHKGRTRWIGTAHAIANRLAGGKLSGSPVSENDLWDFFESEYNVRYDPENEPSRGQVAMQVIKWLKVNEIPLDTPYRAPAYGELQNVWKSHPPVTEVASRWESYKSENRLYDFYEMLEAALEPDEYPGHSATPTVVVGDEYHDVYPMMDRLLRTWMAEADVAIAAGDPRQVVNAYEGSSPEYFERLDLPQVTLPKSYRVPEEHWEAATSVLGRHYDAPDIEVSDGGSIERARSPKFDYDKQTDEWEIPDGKYSPQWCADEYDGSVLYLTRTRKQAAGVAEALKRNGVLFTGQSGVGGWNNSAKRLNLYNALQKVEGVSAESTGWKSYEVDCKSELTGDEAYRLLTHTKADYAKVSREKLDEQAHRLKQISSVELDGLTRVLSEEWWDVYTTGAHSATELTNVTREERIYLAQAVGNNDSPIEKPREIDVSILTIHASKGNEADTVILYDGITTKIQDSMRADDRVKRNEHRTWYVGLTRSSNSLLILDDGFPWCSSFLPYAVGRDTEVVQQ